MWRSGVHAMAALAVVGLPVASASPSPSASPRPSVSLSASARSSTSPKASPPASPAASSSPAQRPSPSGPDPVRVRQWYLEFLHIEQVHQITRGTGVVVGLVDSGVDDHPDLAGSVLPGTDFGPAESDGREDASGHGTQMAGLIAGHGRILGIAPEAKILPVKPAFADDKGGLVDSEEPVRWAVDHGAKVITLAIGDDSADPAWGRAIAYALSKDVVVVAAVNDKAKGTHPSGLAMAPGVVVVSGVGKDGNFDRASLTGDVVTVAAPSQDCWTTRSDGGYGGRSGTDTAAAITSGVVALIRARFPDLDGPGVVARLTATSDDRGADGRDPLYGFGVINPLRALTEQLPSAAPSEAPSDSPTPEPAAEEPEETGPRPLWMALAVGGGVLAVAIGLVLIGRLRARA